MKEPIVLSLFEPNPEHVGAWTGEWETGKHNYGKGHPKIKTAAEGYFDFIKKKTRKPVKFPYELDPDQDIERFDETDPGFILLVPGGGTDIPNYSQKDFERSIYYRLQKSKTEKIQKLQDERDQLNKQLGVLEKELDKLRDEEEERKGKGGERRSHKSYTCPDCGESNARSEWEQYGWCPGCGDVSVEEVEQVR